MGTSPHTPLPIAEADFTQTGYSYTLSLIQGKHKMVILYCLMEYEPVRFNEMRRGTVNNLAQIPAGDRQPSA